MSRSLLAADRVLLLLSLVPYLREHGPTRVAELAETFEVDPRTLRSLIGFLGTAGIPGETLSYQHNDLFDIDWDALEQDDTVSLTHTVAIEETPRFSGAETAALLAGLAALQPLLSPADARLAAELGARLGEAMGRAEVPAVVVSQAEPRDELAVLVRAIERGAPVRFNYRDATGAESSRTVLPETLTEREGVWYLHGFNVERQAQRTFSVAQLTELTELTGGAVPAGGSTAGQAAPSSPASSGGSGRPAAEERQGSEMLALVPVRLLGAIRGFAPEVVSDPESAGLAIAVPPGRALVRVEAWHSGAAVRLAQHGPGEIEIVAPPAARAAVSAWAEAALSAYGE
ncbi:helix-turn-helix transcriptional regulator [Leucobacter albus]|uniref:Helix-turn-helix transcriptional regulator n=1 Tax=Leucobacter albus TaxID=272210 RepID=A0ABW3TJP8_9MICO